MLRKTSFVLAGLFLAAVILGGILLVGILTPKYEPFGANRHVVCGEPAAMRAEGYNLLGGTRYGRGADDSGDDFPLALLDFCSPIVEERPDGEERLWFWFEVDVVGQVFPYTAWGLPWEDIARINPADSRNPVDPIWTPEAVWGIPDPAHTGATWAGRQAHVCTDFDESGLVQFFNALNGYTIPYGTTKSGWVCLTYSDDEHARPLPGAMIITSRPTRARLTRWVDAWQRIHADSGFEGQVEVPPVVTSPAELCAEADHLQPGTVLPDGPCKDV
jgi:hypothetical protein